MRVFVLCTGRCGSTTFAYACKHATNFTTGHESRAKFLGADRFDYPDNHIEIDNRLSWFLGRLEQAYGNSAYYVHLTRDPAKVAESYARRMLNPASIGAAHKRSILMDSPQDELDVCVDVVDTMLANIESFLKDKSHVLHVSVERCEDDFARFWQWIGAEGALAAALAEWRILYNDSEKSHGAIPSVVPETELSKLRVNHRKARKQVDRLQQKVTAAAESAERRNRDLETKVEISEQRCVELESRISTIEALWQSEKKSLQRVRVEREETISQLRQEQDDSVRQLAEVLDRAITQRDAFVDYADQLELGYLRLLKSRTWRVLGPYRFLMRKIKTLLGKPVSPNSLPARPSLDDMEDYRLRRRTQGTARKRISLAHNLDRRLWSGFSQSALRELQALRDDIYTSPKERAEAAYNLARWYSVQGDAQLALEEIRRMGYLFPESREEPRRYLPEALFLCRLGRAAEARSLLESVPGEFNSTVQLMLANTWNPEVAGESVPESEAKVLEHLNSIYDRYGLAPVEKRDPGEPLSMDNLRSALPGRGRFETDTKVTVIIPLFNAEDTIATALTSVAEQTWQNLEVLVVDDASTDGSVDVVRDFCASDQRFRLIRQSLNGGSYLCRNHALQESTGNFVTIHDSDDWSHPEKIERQINDLRERPAPYNLAMWVRTTSALSFFGNSRTLHDLVRPDHSSGLFPVDTFQRFGQWDAVRISGDTELYWRIEHALGNKKWMFNRRQVLRECPLSFGRMSTTSLTQSGPTSVMTIYHGLRREYRDAAEFWHSRRNPESVPVTDRQTFFPVPPMMDGSEAESIRLSLLIVADWNSSDEVLQETMKCLADFWPDGCDNHVGFFYYPRYHGNVTAPLASHVRGFAWDNGIRVVCPGETVVADVVVVLTPAVFEHPLDRFPEVSYERLIVVEDPPSEVVDDHHEDGDRQAKIRQHICDALGEGAWMPAKIAFEELADNLNVSYLNATPASARVEVS